MVKKQNRQNKRISPNAIAIIGTILALIGGFFLSYNYVQKKRIIAFDYMANEFYKEEHKDDNLENLDQQTVTEENNEEVEQSNNDVISNYIGYLEIPKINLKKGFTDINSKDNDVEKNVYVVSGSKYPDVENGNFIIAGHSGTGWKAFFNNLYKLTKEDKVIVRYNNNIYTYKIKNIYNQEKTGKITIYRNYNKTTLTLVTCTNNNDRSQTVYISELESVEKE